ncbi:CPCC family cysteine-rich protein [Chitinibacter sp. GC72]|uniref:CPCC family cysteine-rich protein n=1 Tax=Chitinibacter sp. GC72 TaxID=1526917 RepID=UPI0018DF5891
MRASILERQCDCCDYFSVEANADYEICPICGWEQESWGADDLDIESGANHELTLREARLFFQLHGYPCAELAHCVDPSLDRKQFRFLARDL